MRSPQPGQILQINQYPGEVVNPEGIVSFGQTEQMYVVAEVYETDITRVKLGQKATIISPAFPQQLQGEVTEIGLQIGQQDVLNTDPVSDVDRRVVEVKIRLNPEASAQVVSLSHLQVEVLINGD